MPLAVVVSGGCGLLPNAIPGVSASVVLVAPTVCALGIVATLAWFFFFRTSALRGARDPVQFRRFREQTRVYVCRNETWAREFAGLNHVPLRDLHETKVRVRTVFGIAATLTVTPVFSLLVWDGQFPRIYVDNGSDRAMQIWVDGRLLTSVPPNPDGFHPATGRVSKGKHRLGYSAVGSRSPEQEVDANVVLGYRYLYSPGAGACYWRRVVLYKKDTLFGVDAYGEHHDRAPVSQDGPLSIQQFYDLPGIDYWFENPPEHEYFDHSSLGFWRVALIRNAPCTDMAKQGCSLGSRQALVSCQTVAKSQTEMDRCLARAKVACDIKASSM